MPSVKKAERIEPTYTECEYNSSITMVMRQADEKDSQVH